MGLVSYIRIIYLSTYLSIYVWGNGWMWDVVAHWFSR